MDQAKKDRSSAKRVFTRKANVLRERIEANDPLPALKVLQKQLHTAFGKVEKAHEFFLAKMQDESDINSEESFMLEVEKSKAELESKLAKLSEQIKVSKETNIKVKSLAPPVFTGRIKEYGTFKKDFLRLMFPVYGKDPYALKSCLKGEALECIEGIDDDYDLMFEQLDVKYGNPAKLTEVIVNDLKKLKPVAEGDSRKFIALVDTVHRAFLNLSKVDAQREMSSTYMISLIEKLLPKNIQHEWVKLSLGLQHSGDLMESFLDFLIKEKNVCIYLESDLLSHTPKVSTNMVMNDSSKDEVRDILSNLQSSQSMIVECLNNMAQLVKESVHNGLGNNEPHTGSYKFKSHQKCLYHDTNSHDTANCFSLKKLNDPEKFKILKEKGACFKCLSGGHIIRDCKKQTKCGVLHNGNICTLDHHAILHNLFVPKENILNTASNLVSREGFLLMIGEIKSRSKRLNVMYDPGSNVSLICHDSARRLGLTGKDVSIEITKVGNVRQTIETKEYIVPLEDLEGNTWHVTACGIEEITSPIGKVNVESTSEFFPELNIALNRPYGNVDMLIGIDYCALMPRVVKTLGNLQLMKNSFGYVLRGSHPLINVSNNSVKVNHVGIVKNMDCWQISKPNVKDDIKQYFETENLGTSCTPKCSGCKCGNCTYGDKDYTLKEERELDLITNGLSFDDEKNQWVIKYPWIKDPSDLPNNIFATIARLKATEKRLLKLGSEYCRVYQAQIEDMLNRGVARKLNEKEITMYNDPVFYLPHMEVIKPESTTTPVRIVFNASAKYMGHSLNEYLAKGPDILNSLLGVLLRFRQYNIGLTCDISKMYNSIRMSDFDQNCHRFLWREFKLNRKPDEYVLTHVPFGDRPSGTIAMMALKLTARKFSRKFPIASQHIDRDTYVDDMLISVNDEDHADSIKCEIDWIMCQGGFKIKEWKQSYVSQNHDSDNNIRAETERVLGVKWMPKLDVFMFDVKINFSTKLKKVHTGDNLGVNELSEKMPMVVTKRTLLSQIASQFDPLGLTVPITLQGKILMREITITVEESQDGKCKKLKYDWDDPLPPLMREKWVRYFYTLYEIENLKFPRCVKPKDAVGDPILIIFSDGSKLAYGTCAYVRWNLSTGGTWVRLLMAKTRLAPLRQMTIPRIELCGALIGARMRNFIIKEMNYQFSQIFHLTDSAIVRAQIQKESHGFNTFAATKIAEIQNITDTSEWYWISGNHNPADMTTRITLPKELDSESIWQKGPSFLYDPIDEWPIRKDPVVDLPDRLKTYISNNNVAICPSEYEPIDPLKFSKYKLMLRVTSRILNVARKRSFKAVFESPTAENLIEAETFWIKRVQNNLHPDWQKRFRRLGPTLRSDGVIVVGQRIPKWLKDNYNQNEFVLLPSEHPFTRLYVQHAHSLDHGGIETTLAKIQTKFWIPKVRKMIKSVKNKCTLCRILDKHLHGQIMGQLPLERVKPSPPFMNTAIDLFGPLFIKDTIKKRCKCKVYGVIFNCLSTRAVHIDLVEGYGTKEFLDAFRRFTAIRGCPSYVYSDNGTQLMSANKELRAMVSKWNLQMIEEFGYSHGCDIKWSHPKSCDSPWENGCSEALIKSLKRSLAIAIGNNILTFSELQTTLFEISEIMNERPIGIKPGHSIELGTYLCPNDLLLGRTFNKTPIGVFDTEASYERRITFNRKITNAFWKKWIRDYFPTLIIRQKWHVDRRDLKIGDIVLVQDNNILKGQWKLAEVIAAELGKDNKVRNVNLRYKVQRNNSKYTGENDLIIKRSAHRIVVILPIEERV